MAPPVPDRGGLDTAPGASHEPLAADLARIRADALASARRLVEAARSSADALHEQASRQTEAMLRAARAEVERLTEEANSREMARTVQQVSWDALARVLEAASAEADLMWSGVRHRATTRFDGARQPAEHDVATIGPAVHSGDESDGQQSALDLQAAGEELTQLHELTTALLGRLERAYSGLAHTGGSVRALAGPATDGISTPGLLVGKIDLFLPEHADRMTVEVMIAVLRDQPGITVQSSSYHDQALVVPVSLDRPVPLVAILEELPRVVSANYSPSGRSGSSSADGAITIELGDR